MNLFLVINIFIHDWQSTLYDAVACLNMSQNLNDSGVLELDDVNY